MADTTKILIIEDDVATRTLLKMILAPEGYDVLSAEDGDSGLKTALREMPRLIIVDIMMPNVSGWDVLAALRRDPALQHIPILICSVKDSKFDINMGFRLGADAFLAKPFKPEVLRDKVKKLLERPAPDP